MRVLCKVSKLRLAMEAMRTFLPVIAATCCILFAKIDSASADLIVLVGDTANSTSGLGDFEAKLEYSFSSSTEGSLMVEIKNTASDGFLTAFAFNNPGGISSVVLGMAPVTFQLLGGPTFNNSIIAAPFGLFDIGASTGINWEGGGPPSNGLGAGATGIFRFDFTGSGLDGLATSDFISAFAIPGEGQVATHFFVARFRGFSPSGSDKVPAALSAVPEPPTWLIFALCAGLVLGGYSLHRWRCRIGPYPCHYG